MAEKLTRSDWVWCAW